MDFPATVPYETLCNHNSTYQPGLIGLYEAFYRGGILFESQKKNILVHRQIENMEGGKKEWFERLKRAWYINRAGGLIDWLIAAVYSEEPKISGPGEYWGRLNDDATGSGDDIGVLARDALRSSLVHGRSWVSVDFPYADRKLDATYKILPVESVEDWKINCDTKKVEWARIRNEIPIADEVYPWVNVNRTKYQWIFVTADKIVTYEIIEKSNKSINKKTQVNKVDERTHDFGETPIFIIKPEAGQWVMDRIESVVKQLFNTEADLSHLLSQCAFPTRVLKLQDTQIEALVISEMAALKLTPLEDFEWKSPSNEAFVPLSNQVDKLRNGLYEVVQALAINAMATQTQNARQSATAKRIDREPLQVLLSSFSRPIREGLEDAFDAVARYREDDQSKIELSGFDKYSVDLRDAKEYINGESIQEK